MPKHSCAKYCNENTNTTKKVHDRYENQSKEETKKRDNMIRNNAKLSLKI